MTSERDSLFRGESYDRKSVGGIGGGRKWGAPKETEETKDLDNQGILQLQKKKMNDQDALLDVLAQSISRTKEVAITIGNETDEQVGLLEEIDERVDKTSAKVRNTSRRVERVERKSRTTIMWGCIVVLLLVLIAVVVLAVYT
jgi:tetrahydromethanopterin S-methyltransferase subunit G